MTYTLPPDIEPCQNSIIETISNCNTRYLGIDTKVSSVYYLSGQDVNTQVVSSRYGSTKSSIFQEYFLMKATETLYNSIEIERERFLTENINLPNQRAIEDACYIINVLSELNIYPNNITPTVEEGMCFTFHKAQYRMYLEFYNTGEIGYIIEDTLLKKTLGNEDLASVEQVSTIVERFLQ